MLKQAPEAGGCATGEGGRGNMGNNRGDRGQRPNFEKILKNETLKNF